MERSVHLNCRPSSTSHAPVLEAFDLYSFPWRISAACHHPHIPDRVDQQLGENQPHLHLVIEDQYVSRKKSLTTIQISTYLHWNPMHSECIQATMTLETPALRQHEWFAVEQSSTKPTHTVGRYLFCDLTSRTPR